MSRVEVALAWLDAFARRDETLLLALSREDIRLFGLKGKGKGPGPDGLAVGHAGLRKWFAATTLDVRPSVALQVGERVMIRHGETASVFSVAGGRVVTYLPANGPNQVQNHGFRGAVEQTLAALAEATP